MIFCNFLNQLASVLNCANSVDLHPSWALLDFARRPAFLGCYAEEATSSFGQSGWKRKCKIEPTGSSLLNLFQYPPMEAKCFVATGLVLLYELDLIDEPLVVFTLGLQEKIPG